MHSLPRLTMSVLVTFTLLFYYSVVPGVFGNQQTNYLDIIKQMLSQSLHDKDHPQCWFEAVKATTAFLTTNEEEQSIIHHFKDLLPGVIQVRVTSVLRL